jgi:AraC-like DNA-binding protein/ligand-binding sensor protein
LSQLTYQQIVRFPVIAFYEDAFRKATGVTLAVLPPEEPLQRRAMGSRENAFCALAATTPAGCAACLEVQARAQRGLAHPAAPRQVHCYAGLTDVAVQVRVQGQHVATLMSGQVFRREPTDRDFDMVLRFIGAGRDKAWAAGLRKAYFDTPVVNAERFEAIIQLLTVFAQYLSDYIDHRAFAFSPDEPAAVTSAKRFVLEHVDEPIALEHVVAHVGVSRFYFCKLFKKATGMTLTEYVTRMRLEKAKTLLADPALRISEISYASGFGSIPRFNSVFKQHTGMAPTAFRASLRPQQGWAGAAPEANSQ